MIDFSRLIGSASKKSGENSRELFSSQSKLSDKIPSSTKAGVAGLVTCDRNLRMRSRGIGCLLEARSIADITVSCSSTVSVRSWLALRRSHQSALAASNTTATGSQKAMISWERLGGRDLIPIAMGNL